MTKKPLFILIALSTLLCFISCNQNVDNNVYVTSEADFNSLVKEATEWKINTTPLSVVTFDVTKSIVSFSAADNPSSVKDEFAYFFKNKKLTLRDIEPNGDFNFLNNISTRITLEDCVYGIDRTLSSFNLGFIDCGLKLLRNLSNEELEFEKKFEKDWIATCNGKTASVSINPVSKEMIFTVEGKTNPSVASYKIKEATTAEVVLYLRNIDLNSDFYFPGSEVSYKTADKEIEFGSEPYLVKLTKKNSTAN